MVLPVKLRSKRVPVDDTPLLLKNPLAERFFGAHRYFACQGFYSQISLSSDSRRKYGSWTKAKRRSEAGAS